MESKEHPAPAGPDKTTRTLRLILAIVLGIAVIMVTWVAYIYTFSPSAVRHPRTAHYHFRLQIINNGTPVDFAQSKFQTDFNKDICTAAITKQPIHFHDNLNQFVHIHWEGVTGGMLMKNYGWNLIGGPDNTLGYQFDQLPHLPRIATHGKNLPRPSSDSKYFVYTGTQESYQERDWNSFLQSDLHTFFSGKSAQSSLDWLIPAALAHEGHDHAREDELSKINNVLGSVVIFAQKTKPTSEQIKARFNDLIPLPESSCAG